MTTQELRVIKFRNYKILVGKIDNVPYLRFETPSGSVSSESWTKTRDVLKAINKEHNFYPSHMQPKSYLLSLAEDIVKYAIEYDCSIERAAEDFDEPISRQDMIAIGDILGAIDLSDHGVDDSEVKAYWNECK